MAKTADEEAAGGFGINRFLDSEAGGGAVTFLDKFSEEIIAFFSVKGYDKNI